MASVKTMYPGGPWYACFKVATGKFKPDGSPVFKQSQKATGLRDKNAALMIAMSLEEVAVAAASKRFTDNMARNFLAKVAVATNVSAAQTISLREHLEGWLKSKRHLVAENTTKNYRTSQSGPSISFHALPFLLLVMVCGITCSMVSGARSTFS